MRMEARLTMTQMGSARVGFSFNPLRSLGIAAVMALTCANATLRAELPVTSVPKGTLTVPGRILLRPKQSAAQQTLQATFDRLGAKLEGKISQINVHILQVPEQARDRVLDALRSNPNIEFADPDFVLQPSATPNDPYFSQAWHLPKISAPTAWDTTVGSTTVTIAILDSGIDSTHPDLAGLLVPGWNFYDNNSNLADVSGHGTAVAGIAAALSNNGLGVAGVTWNCRIMPLRITDLSGNGLSSSIANALTWAADHGSRVANVSYGNVSKITTIINAAQYFQSKGGVVTAAAGNSATFDSTADSPYFVLVSATDQNDVLCSWSNTGNNVDLSAPGQNLVTTVNGGGYGFASGTSFSAPTVAGVAALVLSANPSLSGTKVQDILRQNADDLGTKGWDSSYGWGRVNAARAVAAASGQTPPQDTTAPTAVITSPAAGAALANSVSVSVTGSDNVGVTKIEWYLDGALKSSSATSSASFSWNTTTSANGSHTLMAKAYDAAGNVGSSASFSVSVNNPVADTTAPVASVGSPVNGSTVAGTISVAVSGSDKVGVTKVEWYLDATLKGSSSAASAAFSWDSTGVSNGGHTIAAKAYDAAGNVGSSANISVNVNNPVPDTTVPVATLSSPTSGATLSGTLSVTISASDNVGVTKVEWYLDGALQGNNAGAVGNFSWNTLSVANGTHSVAAKAYDAAGNVGTSAQIQVSVSNPVPDESIPVVLLSSPAPNSSVAGIVSVNVSGSDNVGVTKIEWYLDGVLKGTASAPNAAFSWDTASVPNGVHTVTAKGYDAAANVSNPATASVTVNNPVPDTTAPTVVINPLPAASTLSGPVSISVSASDNVSVTKVEWYLDGALKSSSPGSSASFSWDTTASANGTHNISAKAYDAAGNAGTSDAVSVTVGNVIPDTTAPVATVSNPANAATVSASVNVLFGASDDVGVTSVELYIDGALVSTISSPSGSFSWDTSSSANGSHTLQAKAYDAAGNVGVSGTTTVTVNNVVPDTTAPTVQIMSPYSGSKVSKNVKVSVSANDNVGVISIELYIDGKLYQTVAGSTANFSWNTAKVAAGNHSLQAYAYDAAGNKGPSAVVTVTK